MRPDELERPDPDRLIESSEDDFLPVLAESVRNRNLSERLENIGRIRSTFTSAWDRVLESGEVSLPSFAGYTILERIGKGGFGAVYRARDEQLRRDVALKLLLPDASVDPGATQRFLDEARALACIRHPNVLVIHSVLEAHGRIGLVMELIEGQSLDRFIEETGSFSAGEAARIGAEICRALAAVHARGLVHRDVKPSNLLRERGGRIVLTDFGLGVFISGSLRSKCQGVIAGSPLFMSPEQARGDSVDSRTDVYGLGVVLYFLTSSKFPVFSNDLGTLLSQIKAGALVSLRDARPDLPEGFTHIVMRALSLEPEARFQTAGEMEHALLSCLGTAPLEGERKAGLPSPPGGRSWRGLELILRFGRREFRLAIGISLSLIFLFLGTLYWTALPTPEVAVNDSPTSVRPVSVDSAVAHKAAVPDDAQLASRLADLKTRFTKEGPVKTVLDDATAFRVQVNEISQPELQAEAKSFLDDIDECRRIEAAVLSRPVEAVEIFPPFRAVAQHWNVVSPLLQPTAKAGPELRFWLESERTRRIDSLEKRIVPALQTALADAEKARQSYLAWEATPEAYRDAVDRVVEGKTKLMDLFPEKKGVWEAAVKPEAITALEDVASRRAVEGRMAELDKSSATLLAEVEAVKGAAQWKPEMAARVEKESAALGFTLKNMQTSYPRAPMDYLLARSKQIEERRAVCAAHMRAMEEAVLSIQPGKLDEAARKIEALKATGISDPAADRLLAGRQAILDGFQVLFTRLDSINAAAQFSSAEEKLRDFPDAARYAADLKARTDLFREKSSNMALVPAGEVDPPDRKPAVRVDAFFIDRTEVSVREFEQFAAAMAKSKYEDVKLLWPSESIFTKYRTPPEYLRSGNIDPPWPIEDANYYQARAYALWREKDIFTFEEWWLAARGPFRGGTHRVSNPNPRESKNPDRPVSVDVGGVAVAFPTTFPVHHLSGNVAEWCKVDREGDDAALLVGGRYADSSEKKFLGEAPDNTPLTDSRRGYGFRCVLRPSDFYADLLPTPLWKPSSP